MPRTIHAYVHREGRFWVIDLPAVGAVTQALSWEQVRPMAGECAAVALDISPARVRIGALRRVSRASFDARFKSG